MTYMLFGSTNTRHWKNYRKSFWTAHPSQTERLKQHSNMLPGACHTDKNIYWGNMPHLKTSQWQHTANNTVSLWAVRDLLPFFNGEEQQLFPWHILDGQGHHAETSPTPSSMTKEWEEGRRRAPACLLSWKWWWQLLGQARSAHTPWAPCYHHHLWSWSCGVSLPKSQGMQDAVPPQPGAPLRDTALTNWPLTELHTEHIFPPFPSY